MHKAINLFIWFGRSWRYWCCSSINSHGWSFFWAASLETPLTGPIVAILTLPQFLYYFTVTISTTMMTLSTALNYLLSEQSLSKTSLILKRKELPGPGCFPASFRLSVVPCPCTTTASTTVRLFLHMVKNKSVRHSWINNAPHSREPHKKL